MNPSENIQKNNLNFSNKISYFLSRQASRMPRPKFRKIRSSAFDVLRRSLSAIIA